MVFAGCRDHARDYDDLARRRLTRIGGQRLVARDHCVGSAANRIDFAPQERPHSPIWRIVAVPCMGRIVEINDDLDAEPDQSPLCDRRKCRKKLFLDPQEIIAVAGDSNPIRSEITSSREGGTTSAFAVEP